MLDQADEKKSREPEPAEDACCLAPPDQPACSPVADLPIACTLSEAELRERRRMLLDRVRGAAVQVTELPSRQDLIQGATDLYWLAFLVTSDTGARIDVTAEAKAFHNIGSSFSDPTGAGARIPVVSSEEN